MRLRLRRLHRHVVPALFLLGVVMLLFRLSLFAGYRFIGNSDRWNHHLSFVALHSYNLAHGTFSAWCEYLLSGFDTLAAPGNFFSPTFVLPVLLGSSDIVTIFGYVAMAHLAIALLAAYATLHSLCGDRLAAVTGALVFGLSIFSLLKLSQNDNEYLPLVLIPIFFYLVHTTSRANLLRRSMLLTLVVAVCVYIAFLQPFAYVVIFLVSYAAYLWSTGNRAPLLALATALSLGTLLAAPRVLVQLEEISHSVRTGEGVVEHVGPSLFLRYLDGNILGRSWAEAYQASGVNLSEGNLMFACIFASLLLILIIARGRYTMEPDYRSLRCGFFVGFIVVVILVIHVRPLYDLFRVFFLKVSFLHTRFTVAALFPIAIVSSFYLTRDTGWRLTRSRAVTVALLAAAVLALGEVDFDRLLDGLRSVLGHDSVRFLLVPYSRRISVLAPEVLRLLLLGAAFLALLIAARWGAFGQEMLKTTLAIIIIGQSMLEADHFLNGPQTRLFTMPFERYDSVQATAGDFVAPAPRQLHRMHEWLDNEHYRSVILCPREAIAVDCSTAVGMNWRIRLVDGYLNSVSRRYLSLPWDDDVRGGRTIRFSRVDRLATSGGTADKSQWKLLSLLNVRTALLVNPALYSNRGRLAPDGVIAFRNPSPYIYPRVYLASHVASVTTAEAREALGQHFGYCRSPDCSPLLRMKHPVDYVEGPVAGDFDPEGPVSWRFGGDDATLGFRPSSRRRFLVVNEAYNQRWEAYAGRRRLPIYPTNLVMRGVVVPEGVTEVRMRYRSVLDDTVRYLAVGVPLLGLCGLLLRRRLESLADEIIRRPLDRHLL